MTDIITPPGEVWFTVVVLYPAELVEREMACDGMPQSYTAWVTAPAGCYEHVVGKARRQAMYAQPAKVRGRMSQWLAVAVFDGRQAVRWCGHLTAPRDILYRNTHATR